MALLGRFAALVGKGLFAGVAGTAAMTLAQMVEMRITKREPSSAPADAASRVLGVKPKGEEEKQRFSQMVHFAYGTSWGAVRGVLAGFGLGPILGTVGHFAAVWGTALTMQPALDVAPPPTEWGANELAKDAGYHAVYAIGTGLAFAALNRARG